MLSHSTLKQVIVQVCSLEQLLITADMEGGRNN